MIFNRSLLKTNSKSVLKTTYWMSFLALIIISLIGTAYNNVVNGIAPSSNINVNIDYSDLTDPEAIVEYVSDLSEETVQKTAKSSPFVALFAILVGNILSIGSANFFLKGRQGDTNLGNLFSGFKENYGRNVLTMLCVSLFTFLWSLLFIIPGIIKAYEYSMIPYILSENPEISRKEAFERSRQMTKGYKGELFVLDLSFILWHLLCLVTCGLGEIFLAPYITATKAEAYEFLKANLDQNTANFAQPVETIPTENA